MTSIVEIFVEPQTAATLTIWRTGLTNASTTVDLTIDPVMAGLEAVAYTDASGDDQGRIDITVPDDAAPGSYTWTAEIDSVVVWTGQVFIEQNARNTSYVAHSPDIRSLTEPPFIIYRPEDLTAPDTGGAATQIIETSGPTTLDISAVADGEYLQRVGDEIVGAVPSGSGDVTAASNFTTDNRLIRSDGTTKGVQASTATLTDAGNLSGVVDLTITGNIVMSASKTVDGRDVSADWTASAAHFANTNNPHDTAFTLLLDTPTSYTGEAGKFVAVKGAEDGLEFVNAPSGSGDVIGPASATDEAFARFDSTTGKLLQNGPVKCTDAGALTGITSLAMGGALTGATVITTTDLTATGTITGISAADVGADASGTASSAITTHEGKADPHTVYQLRSEQGDPLGYPSLDADGYVEQPALSITDGTSAFTIGTLTDTQVLYLDGTTIKSKAGAGGVSDFTDLGDVPSSYTGEGTKYLAVKASEDGIEFVVASAGMGDVVGPASSTDNAFARFDSTTGKLVQNGPIICSDTGTLTGIDDMTIGGSITMSALETVDGRDISVDGAALDSLVSASTNTVTASSTFGTDNRILRADGTGRGSQASTATLSDAGALSGLTDLTLTGDITMSASKLVDGRDVSVDGTALDGLVAAATNTVTAGSTFATDERLLRSDGTGRGSQASTIAVTDAGAVSGITTLSITDNLSMASGKTVDGRDVSVDGTALDALVTASATYVTASATFATDNLMLRSDGTGRGSQASTIAVTDAGATSGITDLTITGDLIMSASKLVDGVDVSVLNTTVAGKIGGSTGATDNRVLRADGTGTLTVQNSAVTIDDSGNVTGVADLTMSGAAVGVTADKLRETGGPTVLTMGAVSDGQLLARSGSTVAGRAPNDVTFGAAIPTGGNNGDVYLRESDGTRWVKTAGTWAQTSNFFPYYGPGAQTTVGCLARYSSTSFTTFGGAAIAAAGTGAAASFATTNARTARIRIDETPAATANTIASGVNSANLGALVVDSTTYGPRWSMVYEFGLSSITQSNFRWFSGFTTNATFSSDPTTASGHSLGDRIGLAIDANTSLAAKWIVNAANANQQNASAYTLVADRWYRHVVYVLPNTQDIVQELWEISTAGGAFALVASTSFTATSAFTISGVRVFGAVANAGTAAGAGTISFGSFWGLCI